MGDWEDDWDEKPTVATNARPAPVQNHRNNDDDWDEEPQNVCTIYFSQIFDRE